MKPVGLTQKNIVTNPFTGRTSGELMVVHQCLGCGKISPNRIAGDDYPDALLQLLNPSCPNSNYTQIQQRKSSDIHFLSKSDIKTVLITLYGYNYEMSCSELQGVNH